MEEKEDSKEIFRGKKKYEEFTGGKEFKKKIGRWKCIRNKVKGERYKMHTEILRSKVKKKNERKSLTLEKQKRYRRGRETIINILYYYFLYHLIQRKEKKMMERCTLHL